MEKQWKSHSLKTVSSRCLGFLGENCLQGYHEWSFSALISGNNIRMPNDSSILTSDEPKAQVSYCHSALSVVRPSVRRRPSSSVRPSGVNFSHFRLLLWNRWTEFNATCQEARSQCPLSSLCFSGRSEKQNGRPGLWLAETFSTSPLKRLNGIQRNLTGSKISMPSTKFVFFGSIG